MKNKFNVFVVKCEMLTRATLNGPSLFNKIDLRRNKKYWIVITKPGKTSVCGMISKNLNIDSFDLY